MVTMANVERWVSVPGRKLTLKAVSGEWRCSASDKESGTVLSGFGSDLEIAVKRAIALMVERGIS